MVVKTNTERGPWFVECKQCRISFVEEDWDKAWNAAVDHENKTAELFGPAFNHGVGIIGSADKL